MKKENIELNQLVAWIDPASESSALYNVVEIQEDQVLLKNAFSETEALFEELSLLEDTYCCPSCGNIDIQEQGWFYVNVPDSKITEMVDNATIWCDQCDSVINNGSTTCNIYLENKKD